VFGIEALRMADADVLPYNDENTERKFRVSRDGK